MKRKELILTILLLFIDQASKYLVENFVPNIIIIIPNFFKIDLVYNNGAAWSILSGGLYLFIIVALITLFVLAATKKRFETNVFVYPLLYAGIIGNLLDRVIFHHVKDFLSFKIFNYSFPIFNFADIFIVLGAITLYFSMRGESNHENTSRRKRKTKN